MSVRMQLEAARAAMGGDLVQAGSAAFHGVSTDSRAVVAGQAFFALAGDRFDGHAYCAQAAGAGAALLVVSCWPLEVPPGVAVLRVADTRVALGALARAWRRQVAPRVVAITGSVGKTTTKELTRAVLEQTCGPVHATLGNFNNEVGLPLTVLAMPEGTRTLVLELGMNAPGEIARLTAIAEPDIGLITRIAPVHLEGLVTVEAIAAAKAELLAGLGPAALAVVPGEEPLLVPHLAGIAPARRVRFGRGETDDVRLLDVRGRGADGSDLTLSLRGEELRALLPLVGEHNAMNAAAAAAVGMVAGVPAPAIAAGLTARPELGHRSRLRELGSWRLLDDCYNANPVAVRAALDTLGQLAGGGEQIAVLGDMLELGPSAEQLHLEVGRYAAGRRLALLVTVGALGAAIARGAREAGMPAGRVVAAEDAAAAAAAVAATASARAWILVKASRGARLEKVIEALGAVSTTESNER